METKPYKLASREYKKEDTVVEIPNSRGQIVRVGGSRIVTMAGPCAVAGRRLQAKNFTLLFPGAGRGRIEIPSRGK